jgi:hypothetical protein
VAADRVEQSGLRQPIPLAGFEVIAEGYDLKEKRAGALPGEHRDPFDRMLIAQAQAENLSLVSNERLFDTYGIRRIWLS